MSKYIRVARVYPAILGVLPTMVLLASCMGAWFPYYRSFFSNIEWFLELFGGTLVFSAAAGYATRELFRETSKHLFQYPLFKLDETEMPTTKMLLWQNEAIPEDYHNEIMSKVKSLFGITLPSKEEEAANIREAKQRIVSAVAQIRQVTRNDHILQQYNTEFGFCRNYLGASFWSLLSLLVFAIVNVVKAWFPWGVIFVLFILQVLAAIGCYWILEERGWIYAKYLFSAFIGNKIK